MESIRIMACAKLNLTLRVVGRRSDGYHLLQSLMTAVDLADELLLRRDRRPGPAGIRLWAPPELGPPEENLVVKAACLLLSFVGMKANLEIKLTKRIPMGAGLGGGSSDAAATLVGLNKLLGIGLSQKELVSLGVEIGADVPFFLGSSPAWVEGIGEQCTPIKIELPGGFLILVPPVRLSTSQVYKIFDKLGLPFSLPTPPPTEVEFHNDLWPAALELCPELGEALAALRMIPSLSVGMTGSGSALFAAFPTRKEAEKMAKSIAHLGELFVVRPVPQGYFVDEAYQDEDRH